MLSALAIILTIAAIALLRVSLFASGLCWFGVFYVATLAEKRTRESRLFPAVLVLAAVAFLVRVGVWAWHVI